MSLNIKQYDIVIVNLDPTIGSEIKKTRPCIVLSPNEINENLKTLIIAPLTTKGKNYPTRVSITINKKQSWIAIDQIRTIDKQRLVRTIASSPLKSIVTIKAVLKEMLVD